MRSGVIAQKVGMTRVYMSSGEGVPVTVLKLDGCQVVAQRTKDKNGTIALQLGFGLAPRSKHTPKAERGQTRPRECRGEDARLPSFVSTSRGFSLSAPRSRPTISLRASSSM